MASLSAQFSLAAVRVFSTPASSPNSFSSWSAVLAAFMPPVDLTELPPTAGWLSTTMTLMPASAALMAAVMPAPPAPTITTSASRFRSSAASSVNSRM